MKNRRIIAFMTVLAVLFSASCNKDNSSTPTKYYLGGSLRIGGNPHYTESSARLTFSPRGVIHPEGKLLGMYYTVSCGNVTLRSADTLHYASAKEKYAVAGKGPLAKDMSNADFSLCLKDLKDTLANFSVSVVVFSEDNDKYYVSSSTATITVVDPEKSIPQISTSSFADVFQDARDASRYGVVQADPLKWLSRNLAYIGDPSGQGGAIPYMSYPSLTYIFGAYYTWEAAQSACPPGWRLPTGTEWDAVVKDSEGKTDVGRVMVDAYFNGNRMWAFWPSVKVTNASSLGVISAGMGNIDSNTFVGEFDTAAFWTSDQMNGQGVYRYIRQNDNSLKTGLADKSSTVLSVRCVK